MCSCSWIMTSAPLVVIELSVKRYIVGSKEEWSWKHYHPWICRWCWRSILPSISGRRAVHTAPFLQAFNVRPVVSSWCVILMAVSIVYHDDGRRMMMLLLLHHQWRIRSRRSTIHRWWSIAMPTHEIRKSLDRIMRRIRGWMPKFQRWGWRWSIGVRPTLLIIHLDMEPWFVFVYILHVYGATRGWCGINTISSGHWWWGKGIDIRGGVMIIFKQRGSDGRVCGCAPWQAGLLLPGHLIFVQNVIDSW